MLLNLLYIVLPSTSSVIFRTLKCTEFEWTTGEYWYFLASDYSVRCDAHEGDSERIGWLVYASCMMLVYPLGIPLFFAVLLYMHRHDLCPRLEERGLLYIFVRHRDWGDGGDEVSEAARERTAHLSFLTDSYETQCFWFEVAECARRLMLSSVLILFERGTGGSVSQKIIAICICLFSLRMYTYYKPYDDNDDDLLAEAAIWQYLAILFAALLIHVDSAPGDQEHLGLLLIFISCIGFAIMMFALLHVLFREILVERYFGGRVAMEKSKSSKVTPALPPVEEHADETSPADNSSNDSNNNRQTSQVVDATNDDSSSDGYSSFEASEGSLSMKEYQADSDHGSVFDSLETSLTRHAAIAAAAELTTAAVEDDDTSSGYSSD